MSIEITPALLAEKRKIAEAATPGPWDQQGLANLLRYAQKHDGPWNDSEYVDCSISLPEEADAAHIVENSPDRVLQLLDLINELADRLQSMMIQRDCRCGHPACKRCKEDRLTQELLAKVKGNTE